MSAAVCRNCAGEEWVCENHEDSPWNERAAFGCECGAGAPCPVCNKEMACAGLVFVATDPLKKTIADLLDALRTKRDYVADVVDGFNKITPAIHEMAQEDLARIDAAIAKATTAVEPNSVGTPQGVNQK